MKTAVVALTVSLLGMALHGGAWTGAALAGERFTLEFPSRELAGSLDRAAIVRVGAPFGEGSVELSKAAESAFLSDLLRVQKGLPRTGPILVTIEYRNGDAKAAELSYRRLKWLRSAILAKQAAFSTDRVVIAALAREAAPLETEVLLVPVELELPGDGAADGGLRAVALDSAFVGPVFVRLDSGPEADLVSTAPIEPTLSVEPATVPEVMAPAPTAPQADAPPEVPAAKSEAAIQPPAPTSAKVVYRTVWCPAPDRPLDDFYPGGPIVPCGTSRP